MQIADSRLVPHILTLTSQVLGSSTCPESVSITVPGTRLSVRTLISTLTQTNHLKTTTICERSSFMTKSRSYMILTAVGASAQRTAGLNVTLDGSAMDIILSDQSLEQLLAIPTLTSLTMRGNWHQRIIW